MATGYYSASAGFYSDLADLETNLSTGLGQVTSAMSNFKGKFTVPKSKDMAWAKASNKKWDQRAKVIERMNSQQPFDSEFLSEVSDYMGGDYNTEKEILVYDTMYGYAIYKVALNVSKDGKVNLSTEDGKVTGVSSGNASVDIENGKVKGGKVNSKESKSNFGNGFVVGSSSSLALSGTGASNSSTTTVEKNGKKTTVTVENGVKERHGNMAYYNKTTEKTSLDRKIADTDVTSELSTSKELGLYQSYNPTGFAPVTNQVREFDWDQKVNELEGVISTTTNTIKTFTEEHPVITGIVGTAAAATVAYFAWPVVTASATYTTIVEVGSAITSAIVGLWNMAVG